VNRFTVGLWRHSSALDIDFYIARVMGDSAIMRYFLRRNGWELGEAEVVRLPTMSAQWSRIK
jgi:hypothetical protein